MIEPKVDIIASSNGDGSGETFTYIVDPNPEGLDMYNPEDRFLYVNLEAFRKSRSVIVQDESGTDFSSSTIKNPSISFIATQKQGQADYLTTDYINVDGVESSVEGFGIRNITITMRADFIPKVDIEFFDLRGSAIKSFDLNGGTANSDSPLSAFFTYPYPLFKLTVKGFYGNAVSYCLHLTQSNYTFSSEDAGFIINASFVGYTYGFLSSIPIKYLHSITNTDIGQNKLSLRSARSLSEVIADYGKLTRFVSDYKKSSEQYESVRSLNTLKNRVDALLRMLGRFIDTNDGALIGSKPKIEALTNQNSLAFRNVCIFSEFLKTEYADFFSGIENEKRAIDDLSASTGIGTSQLNFSSLALPLTLYSAAQAIEKTRTDIQKNEAEFEDSALSIDDAIERISNFEDGKYFIVDFYEQRKELLEISKRIDNEKNQIEQSVKTDLNEKIRSIFNPTVDNFFKDFCENVEVFCEIIYETAIAASAPNLREQRLNVVQGVDTDIRAGQVIHPFPDIAIDGKKAWPGQMSTANEENFPEIKLVNLFVNAIFDENNLENQLRSANALQNQALKSNDEWIGLNVLDIFDNDYLNVSSSFETDTFYIELLNRFFAGASISKYIDSSNAKTWGQSESLYVLQAIKNNDFISLIANNATNAQSILNEAVARGLLFFENGSYISLNEKISGIEFSQNNILIFKDLNTDVFKDLSAKGVNYSSKLSSFLNNEDNISSLAGSDGHLMSAQHILFKNISLDGFNENALLSQYSSIDELESLIGIEGQNFEIFSEDNIYTRTQNNFIGKYNNNSIFDINGYSGFDDILKDYLLLSSFNFENKFAAFFEELSLKSFVCETSKIYLLYIGCALDLNNKYRSGDLNSASIDFINDNPSIFLVLDHIDFDILPNYNAKVIEDIIAYYQRFDTTLLTNDVQLYVETYSSNIGSILNSAQYDNFVAAYNNTLSLAKTKESIIVSQPNAVNNTSLPVSAQLFETFYNEFIKVLKQNLADNIKDDSEIDSKQRVLNDNDFLIEIYNDIKSIYDKWLAYGTDDGKVFNVCYDNKQKPLFEHFYFIDRAWNDIGSQVVLSPRSVLKMFKNPQLSAYQFVGNLLNENNFMVHFAPAHIGFNNTGDLKDMFSPQTNLKNMKGNPAVIAFYVGELSKTMNADSNYAADGFDLVSQDMPNDFSEKKVAQRHLAEKNNYNISAFLVNHGQTNQQHFQDVSISTTEYQNTSEYLKTQSDILDRGGNIKRFYKGLDIYDLYRLRSYTARVKAIGNMMIQPYQYFQLNVPLFKGAYIITEVTHQLFPHQHTTQFSGQKISRYIKPVVTDVTSYIELPFNETLRSPDVLSANQELSEDSVGFDRQQGTPISDVDVSDSNTILFNISGPSNNLVQYKLRSGLTMPIFEDNLSRVFLDNGSLMSTYGLKGDYCMSWVKNALADVGVVSEPFFGLHAWQLYAGMPNGRLKYFDSSFSALGVSQAYDYSEQISDEMAIVFGFFNTSKWRKTSIATIKAKNDLTKIEKLSELNRTNFEITPITHVGIYLRGRFYDLVKGRVHINRTTSFVPIAYTEIFNDIDFLLS